MKYIMAVVNEGKNPYKCTTCDFGFAENGKLKQHIPYVHENKIPHKCNMCDVNFVRNYHLTYTCNY